jgi:hypothetical protein
MRIIVRFVAFSLALLLVSVVVKDARGADCPALPPPYTGPIFDANVQSWNPDVEGLIDAIAGTGVQRIAFFANSHAGGAETANAVAALAREHPDLIVLGAPKIGFIRGGDLPREFVSETVAGVAAGTYHFVGEILYTHGDKPDNLMYGSDFYSNRNSGWTGYPRVIERYRQIAGQLPADVAKRISWDNAAALYGH